MLQTLHCCALFLQNLGPLEYCSNVMPTELRGQVGLIPAVVRRIFQLARYGHKLRLKPQTSLCRAQAS